MSSPQLGAGKPLHHHWYLPQRVLVTHEQPPRPGIRQILWSGIGGLLAIGLVAFLGRRLGAPLLIAPFAASAYLLYGEPDSPYSQPRNVVGGYLLCGTLGLGIFHLWGVSPLTHAVAVAAALILMEGTRVLHPPAAGVALLPLLGGDHSPWFLLVPLLAGSLLLVAVACVVNNMVPGRRYPHFW